METVPREQASLESITVAIPTHNEEATLEAVVGDCIGFFRDNPGIDYEILVVDDGSTDRSPEIARRLAGSFPQVRLYRHDRRRGFSEVQRSAYAQAAKDWVFILPADGQISAAELTKFIAVAPETDLVLGTRTMRLERFSKVAFSRLYYCLVGLMFGTSYSDYGACWMVRKRLCEAVEIASRTPVAITELLVHALMGGARVAAVQVFEYPRSVGKAKWTRPYLQVPRVFLDLLRLYRRTHAAAHPYYKNPKGYQKAFREKLARPDVRAPK